VRRENKNTRRKCTKIIANGLLTNAAAASSTYRPKRGDMIFLNTVYILLTLTVPRLGFLTLIDPRRGILSLITLTLTDPRGWKLSAN